MQDLYFRFFDSYHGCVLIFGIIPNIEVNGQSESNLWKLPGARLPTFMCSCKLGFGDMGGIPLDISVVSVDWQEKILDFYGGHHVLWGTI